MDHSLTAVVVTFRPDADVVKNIQTLAQQVGDIVVVDNGSNMQMLAPLRALATAGQCALVEMGFNAGLGAALNAGLHAAYARGAQATFLFDQDSRIADGFVTAMTRCLAEAPSEIGIVIPHYIDRSTNEEIPPLRVNGGPIEAVMTSGALMRRIVTEKAGFFDESLFIDCTDYELSLRMRRAGFSIIQADGALLYHAPAARVRVRFAGRTLCTVSHYSPKRRYYIARNSAVLLRQAGRDFPGFKRALWRSYIAETAKILLFEKDKIQSARMILRGIRDARRGRMGYVIPL